MALGLMQQREEDGRRAVGEGHQGHGREAVSQMRRQHREAGRLRPHEL